MSNLVSHAETELDLLGMTADSPEEMNVQARNCILHLVSEFAKQGHSGMSGPWCTETLYKLLKFEPLLPLTGEDSEWDDVSDMCGSTTFQNKRCSRVFKNETGAYDIHGKVFYEWITVESGEEYQSYYTNSESKVSVTFPYNPKTVYEEIKSKEQE